MGLLLVEVSTGQYTREPRKQENTVHALPLPSYSYVETELLHSPLLENFPFLAQKQHLLRPLPTVSIFGIVRLLGQPDSY